MNYLLAGLASIVGLATTLLTGYVLYRSRTPEILRAELQIQREKSERLEKENAELHRHGQDQSVEIEKLKARTDLDEIRKGQTAILEIIATQSASILDNQARTMAVLTASEKAMVE